MFQMIQTAQLSKRSFHYKCIKKNSILQEEWSDLWAELSACSALWFGSYLQPKHMKAVRGLQTSLPILQLKKTDCVVLLLFENEINYLVSLLSVYKLFE